MLRRNKGLATALALPQPDNQLSGLIEVTAILPPAAAGQVGL
jgi:hypothetical protein